MSIEFGKVIELTKRTGKYISAPTIAATAVLTSGCDTSTNFPPCNRDPQDKSQIIQISEEAGWFDFTADIDGVKFSVSETSPRRVDIEAREGRIELEDNVLNNKIKFNGRTDGRAYEVTFPKKMGRR